MLCKEIIQVIEASYPKEAALDFDNVGLLAGRLEKEGPAAGSRRTFSAGSDRGS